MSPKEFLTSDRRVMLLLLSAVGAIYLGFFAFSPDRSIQLVIYGGYWAMLAISIGFGWSLWCISRDSPWSLGDLRDRPKWPAALVAVSGIVLIVHESFGFKILMDEVMLLGTSMSMHFEKTALVPMRGNDLQGAFQLMAGQLDKRPLFHPFLMSLLHDLTGYRPENAFVLNVLLTFVLLALVYIAASRINGRGAGGCAVLLLTGLPLLAQNATGGGFEILNLVMILATYLLAIRFVDRRDSPSLSALCLGSVLLAETRYESVVFLIPVAGLVVWVWWKERRLVLSWGMLAMPLLLVPYALQNKVFTVRQSSWELAGQPGHDRVFAFSYIPENISHWLNFFFDTTGDQSNSLVLSVLGFLSLPFALLLLAKSARRLSRENAALAAFVFMAAGFILHSFLYLCYFWGKFDDVVIRRLSLPLNLFLVFCIVLAAAELLRRPFVWKILATVAVGGLFLYSLPAMARHDYTLDYYVGREMEWRREFIKAHPEKDYLVIDNNSICWITHQVSATPVQQAREKKSTIAFNMRNHTFTDFYVFQRFIVDPATGDLHVQAEDDLGPDYQLETYWQQRFTPFLVSRISRVLSVREGPATPVPSPAAPTRILSPDEREKIRQEYYENFIRHLP